MHITFRSGLRPNDIGILIIAVPTVLAGLAVGIRQVPSIVTALLLGMPRDAGIDAAFLAIGCAVGWMGWVVLPPLRRVEVTFAPEGVTLRGYGQRLTIPWTGLDSLAMRQMPVLRRLPGNGPPRTWHLVATPAGGTPVAVPLDTIPVPREEIVAAFRRTAPDTVELELVGD